MLGLASVLLLGIGAQWLAWRLRVPSILLLLGFGFVAGPLSGQLLLHPDELMGRALQPFVSLAVAIILLEGGLSLRFQGLRGGGAAVRNLILLGVPLTWLFSAAAARWILGWDWSLALLLGAILVVTGPTVIIPLLRHIRPSGTVGSVARWEGIVTDPIGAILAVLVFQVMVTTDADASVAHAVVDLAKGLIAGVVAGIVGAGLLVFLLRRDLVPDFLHAGVTLALGIAAFVVANEVHHESGLFATTLMGILLANQRYVAVEHIVEFKENLQVLLISSLFILLAARVPAEEFRSFDLKTLAFVLVLILLVRPAMIFLSTLGTSLTTRERVFLAWMAPRGIVAAAVSSVFALELEHAGYPGGDRLVSVVFGVIVLTVAVYGLTAGPLARRLALSKGVPQGCLILGAHAFARQLAGALRKHGIRALLVDTNHHEVQAARIEGLDAFYGSILADDFEENVALDGIGRLLCLTPNDEVNSLACIHFAPLFGRSALYQLASENVASHEPGSELPLHLRGRLLFSKSLDFWDIQARIRAGHVVKSTRLGEEFGYDDLLERYKAPPLLLALIEDDRRVRIMTSEDAPEPKPGDVVIALVDPRAEEVAAPRAPAARSAAPG